MLTAQRTVSPISSLKVLLQDVSSFCGEQEAVATQDACSDAMSKLQFAYDRYVKVQAIGAVVSFPLYTTDVFVNLLKVELPVAVLVIACYGCVLDQLRERWWVKSAGKRLVEACLSKTLSTNPTFAALLERAGAEVGLLP